MSFDPLEEFEKELQEAVAEYRKAFENQNEFHKQPHTWQEWMSW